MKKILKIIDSVLFEKHEYEAWEWESEEERALFHKYFKFAN